MTPTLMSMQNINKECLNEKFARSDIPIYSHLIFSQLIINFGFFLKRQGSVQDRCNYAVKGVSSLV